ncbi:MAG: hypothetical protein H7Y41_04705 [Hyphomonadaceae bacterium]|nr:hypothetical protein [Clostridia bacterium]
MRCEIDDLKACDDCGDCDTCSLDPQKHCDNCEKCLDFSKAYETIQIDKIILETDKP